MGGCDPLGVVRETLDRPQGRSGDDQADGGRSGHGRERDEQKQESDPCKGVIDLAQQPGNLDGRVLVETRSVDPKVGAGDRRVSEERRPPPGGRAPG